MNTINNNKNPLVQEESLNDKILNAIKKYKGSAKFADIRHSLSLPEFSRDNGRFKLQRILYDLASKGVIAIQTTTGTHGRPIETYHLVDSNVSEGSTGSVQVTCTFSIPLDGRQNILNQLFSLLNPENSNSNENKSKAERFIGTTKIEGVKPPVRSSTIPDELRGRYAPPPVPKERPF